MTEYTTVQTSVDKAELDKFSKASSEWWNKDGEFKILHQINPVRLQFITDKIRQHFKADFTKLTILDIGCGGGLVTLPLYELGADVTGIDASLENIKTASAYASTHNLKINYIHTTVEELVSHTQQYDVVLCLEVIEHVANVDNFIKNLATLVKPGGMLILSTINRNIKSYFLAVLMAEYILGWVPKKTHDYYKFLKPSEISSKLNRNQLHLKELKGLTFDLFTNSWKLSEDIDVNYFAYAVK